MYSPQQKPSKSNNELLRYAGLGMQIFVSLGIAVFFGVKIDKWLHFAIPVFAWVLPLIVLCLIIYKTIKQTSKPR
jgi:hypothetical protein